MKEEAIKAWHFLANDRRLKFEDGREVVVGETLECRGLDPPQLCRWGMHASVNIIDALEYAPGTILCRVEVWGDVEHGEDKLVGRRRKCLQMADIKGELIAFAEWCAERAQGHANEAAKNGSTRPRLAATQALRGKHLAPLARTIQPLDLEPLLAQHALCAIFLLSEEIALGFARGAADDARYTAYEASRCNNSSEFYPTEKDLQSQKLKELIREKFKE